MPSVQFSQSCITKTSENSGRTARDLAVFHSPNDRRPKISAENEMSFADHAAKTTKTAGNPVRPFISCFRETESWNINRLVLIPLCLVRAARGRCAKGSWTGTQPPALCIL